MDNKIIIVGLGPGSKKDITLGTFNLLKQKEHIYLRTEKHPIIPSLREWGISFRSFDPVYKEQDDFQRVYSSIAQELIKEVKKHGEILYAVPGNPLVAEETVEILLKECKNLKIHLEMVPALSFIDTLMNSLKIDPIHGLKILDGMELSKSRVDVSIGNIITQVYSPLVASEVKLGLMEYYGDETMVWVIRGAGVEGLERKKYIPLYQLDRLSWIDHLTSVYIPPVPLIQEGGGQIERLLGIMEILRSERGCPWDREQTHESLTKHLIEETYEVVDAIERDSPIDLEEELGDILLQVVFHSQIAKENKKFTINDVIGGICDKLIFRHPHIFSNTKADTPEEVLTNWEKLKKIEKGMKSQREVLRAVPTSFPALMRAFKIQKKAADVGFDWDHIEDVRDKIVEEWLELKDVYKTDKKESIIEEIGDLLFSIVNLCRFLDVQPEKALIGTIDKFINRFSFIELNAEKMGKNLEDMSLEDMENLWKQAKIHNFNENYKKY